MRIDWDKPVQTRDGRSVRILCTDMEGGSDTVAGIVKDTDSGFETAESWRPDGRYFSDESPTDLVNVPERHEAWVNGYSDGACFAHRTREDADENASHIRRIACIKVEFEEGEGL